MSRVKEAQELLDMITDLSKQSGDADSVNRITMAPLLCDIAMSLAVIADSLTEPKEETNDTHGII